MLSRAAKIDLDASHEIARVEHTGTIIAQRTRLTVACQTIRLFSVEILNELTTSLTFNGG